MSSKFRMALAGLTAAALIGGVMVADPADAGKKKHKKVKVIKKKVKKVKKGNSVKQVSKGGNAKAGNGGNGGAGGSSGNVYNTGNVGVGTPATPDTGPGVGVTEAQADCILGLDTFGDDIVDFEVPFTEAEVEAFFEDTAPGPQPDDGCGPLPEAFTDCLIAEGAIIAGELVITVADVNACLVVVPGTPAVPGGGGAVFSGNGGAGAPGGDGGSATGGDGGSNSNVSTVTVTRDDHSIDVD